MIVNFIGVDKTGKTTLIDEVASELEWPVKRFKAPFTNEQIESNVWEVIDTHERDELDGLYERWNYPEDLIYGPVIEGQDSVLKVWGPNIEIRLLEIGCLFVYTTASLQLIARRINLAGGDYYIKLKHVPILRKAYLSFLERTRIPYIEVDTTYLSIKENVDKIIIRIKEALHESS